MGNMIPSTIVYKKYGIPRSLLRSLAESGIVRRDERQTGGPFVLKLYSEDDIVRFLNSQEN